MDLTSFRLSAVIDRLLKMEKDAAHLSVLADVAAAYAHVAREKADSAQAVLSEVKIWIALLPDTAKLELRAARPGAEDPALRLGVKAVLPIPKPDPRLPESAPSSRPVDRPEERRGSRKEALFRPGGINLGVSRVELRRDAIRPVT